MFELAQFNVSTQGRGIGGSSPCVGRRWEWGVRSVVGGRGSGPRRGRRSWGLGVFDPSAANRGAYAGLEHGITSRPKSKPNNPAAPATGGPP